MKTVATGSVSIVLMYILTMGFHRNNVSQKLLLSQMGLLLILINGHLTDHCFLMLSTPRVMNQ
jgi:hypothetical protein